jgi:hypothetical protein
MSHQAIRRLMPLTTLLCLLLVRSATAGEAKVLLKAQVVGDPVVTLIRDNAQGWAFDKNGGQDFRNRIAGTEWILCDNGELLIAWGEETLETWKFAPEPNEGLFWIHVRDGGSQVDGQIFYDGEKKKGFGQLFWTILSKDGRSSRTANVFTLLSFAP